MSMNDRAENEIKIACKRERAGSKDTDGRDYGCTCYESALKAYHDIDYYYCIDINNDRSTYHSGVVSDILHQIFPITMPYIPEKPIKVYCEEFLTDRANGDFDTIGIIRAVKPSGEVININRYFKEDENGRKEIDTAEYIFRKSLANKLKGDKDD